jgi:hypothetical protein
MLQLPRRRPRSSGLSHVAPQRHQRSLLQLQPARPPCCTFDNPSLHVKTKLTAILVSVTARLLHLVLLEAPALPVEDLVAVSAVDMAATLALPLATNAVAPITLPVTVRPRL